MKSVLLFILLAYLTAGKKVDKFSTEERQVYAAWSVCDTCACNYYYIVAFEHTSQNPADTVPPFYFYYSHSLYDSCLSVYQYEYYTSNNVIPGLDITRSGRNAELVNNFTDSAGNAVRVNLNWSTQDSQNTNVCNCQTLYVVGIDSYNIKTRSGYRQADVTGTLTIGTNVQQVSQDGYGYIYGYGTKTIVFQHK